ncbi:Carboxypeptidase S [Cyberlindnera fabianii]|uniref:Carboxypeptidase S n=1 Tax=Cyberlindnera fabianii TaxID=36022 RepID=A0A1V2LBV1_CYBFA|nr:Carboxypeptidase S [Cyberlindnera fabianii]
MSIDLSEKRTTRPSRLPWLKSITLVSALLVTTLFFSDKCSHLQMSYPSIEADITTNICPIGQTIRPSSFYKDNSSVEYIIHSPDYRAESVAKLSGAVKIPTVVHDHMPTPEEDPSAWSEFPKFHAYLEKEFPLIHEKLVLEKVNSYGLVYTWKGSNESLKPILIAGHQDVVPVEESTKKDWLYEPFEGYFDGTNIWGRGSSDDKSMGIGTLQAIEKLLCEDFVPERGIVLAFGFDEEVSGPMGAASISKFLEERYGIDSFHVLIDEGGTAIGTIGGGVFAQPSVGEKGSISLRISLTTPGGHSSVPPEHTNIGLISKLISYIEDHPFSPILGPENPTLNFIQCVAKYSDEYPKSLKRDIFAATYDKVANSKVLKYLTGIKAYKFLVTTSQAVDIIQGGVKVNALPEYVSFDINHRISIESSVNATIDKILDDVTTVAEEYGLGAYFEDQELKSKTTLGFFNVSVLASLEPAKISPMDDQTWFTFAGSIKHIIEDYIYPNMTQPAIVSGSLNTGNTDTAWYWSLTDHIYRFKLSTMHGILEGGTHSVNEHTTIDNQLYLIAFMYEYIKSIQEYDG